MQDNGNPTTQEWVGCHGRAWRNLSVAGLLVIALAGGGGQNERAVEALAKSVTPEELASAVSEYGSSAAGTGLRLCLAKEYFDAAQYQAALGLYEAVLKAACMDDPFRDIAELGRAYALEGLKRYAEAIKAYSSYAFNETKVHDGFRLTALLGVARCKALQGDVAGAEAFLNALKSDTIDKQEQTRIDETRRLLKHYDFRCEDLNSTDALTLVGEPEVSAAPVPKKAAPADTSTPLNDRWPDGAGQLGGEKVTSTKFEDVRADVLAEMLFQYGREISVKSAQLNKEVWSRLAMLKVAEDLNLTATDEQVRDAIHRNFQDESGTFSSMFYQAACARLGWPSERLEAYFRRQLTLMPVQRVAATANWISPLELSSAVRDATDKITVRIARFQHTNVDDIKLDDAALKAYYESHTNLLALPELKVIRYVTVPADDEEDLRKVEVSDDDLQARFDETSDRYGTNAFETVKAQVEREFRLEKAVEAAAVALYARVCPEGAVDDGVDRLAQLAKEKKLEVKVSSPFALSGDKVMPGFMVEASSVLPDAHDFLSNVADLDPNEPYARYRAIAGSNVVYVVGLATNLCTEPRVPSFEEVKGNESIRRDALAELKAKNFKKDVDKVREAIKADLSKRKDGKLDPKLFGDANVSTSITFVAQTAMCSGAFPDAYSVIPMAVRLSKGDVSEFVPTALPGHGLVVYVEDRQPGVVGDAFEQSRMELSRRQAMLAVQAWKESNMARLGVKPSAWASMEETLDDDDDDGDDDDRKIRK